MGAESPAPSKRRELLAFFVITAVVAPLATVAFVGAYGFAIWAYQLLLGPPTG